MALPYIELPRIESGPAIIQPFGLIMIAAIALGTWTALRTACRAKLPRYGLLALAIPAAWIFAHVWDVIAYRWNEHDATLWFRIYDGISLFGAFAGIAVTTVIVARGRQLGRHFDAVALGTLVAMTIGRIGCALVHDHPGTPTDLPIGIEFPAARVAWLFDEGPIFHGDTIRLHDLGFEELLALVPLTAIAFVLARKLRPGMTAAIAALAYALTRFLLDFLRVRATEPLHAGLTAGQIGCMLLAVGAIVGLSLAASRPRAPA
jgi:phosphatidylglycerol:prolipoprotein diacylglycerol transferase